MLSITRGLAILLASLAVPYLQATCVPTSLACWGVAGNASASDAHTATATTLSGDVAASILRTDLGMPGAFVNASGITATDGSALFKTLTLNPGDILSFSWTTTFETNATGFSFMWVDSQLFTLAQQQPVLTQNTAVDIGAGVAGTTTSGTFTHTVSQSGSQTLGIGVVNGSGSTFQLAGQQPDPWMTTSIFTITPVSPAPEPGSIGLAGAGLLVCGWLRRKPVA